MKKLMVSLVLCCFAFICNSTFACQRGYYSDDLGICWPGGSTVVEAVNPLPDILIVLGSAVKGDVNGLTRAIGGLVIKSSCPGCEVLLSGNDKALVETIVGRGWLIFLETGNPYLVIVDAANTAANGVDLGEEEIPQTFSAPPTQVRQPVSYEVDGANCMVENIADEKVVVGFVDAPTFKSAGNENKVFPNVTVLPVDTVKVKSKNDCAQVPQGQRLVFEATINVSSTRSSMIEGPVMKYFLVGKMTEKNKVVSN
jgi:hypothetical protein